MSRRFQYDLVTALKAGGETGGQGVIGYDAGFNLQRLPSVVYWQGLGEYGIRRFHGSLADYHRSLDGYRRRLHEFKNEDGGARGDGEELAERFQPNWDAHLPEPPPDLWTETTLELTSVEAEYLVERIRFTKPGYLLSHLLDHLDQPFDDTKFPWEHPAVDLLPSKARNRLDHARLFSEVMHGAPLLYNLMLGELKTQRGLNVDDRNSPDAYRERLEQWAELIGARSRAVQDWDIADFWLLVTDVNPNISNPTRQFIDTWIRLVRTDLDDIVSGADHVRTLIADRERRRKGAQARLFSDRALELWSGAAGTVRSGVPMADGGADADRHQRGTRQCSTLTGGCCCSMRCVHRRGRCSTGPSAPPSRSTSTPCSPLRWRSRCSTVSWPSRVTGPGSTC